MKAEQVCRFRVDKGYSVFAKSPDLRPTQEDALGKIFNDKMNELFPDLGYSFLCCAQGASDVFLARNTLLTSGTRKSMFTHAYVFSKEDYALAMQESPLTILGVDMQSMLDNDAINPDMPPVELTASLAVEPVEALFAKYQLDADRYKRLLFAAYTALIRGTSLQFVTTLPYDQTSVVLRELILCVLDGLLPCLKGKISFSTGPDAARTFSVVSLSEKSRATGRLLFGAEDDTRSNIAFGKENLPELVFSALAEMSGEERARSVEKMQKWLDTYFDPQKGLSMPLVCAAFCMTCDLELAPETRMDLFAILSDAKIVAPEVVNKLLTALICKMQIGTPCTEAEYSRISGYYLHTVSDEEFQGQADLAFQSAPVASCIAAAEKAFEQSKSERSHRFLKVLARRIPADEAGLSADLRERLIRWVMGSGEQAFAEYAKMLVISDPSGENKLRGALISWMLDQNTSDCTEYAIELLKGCNADGYLNLAMAILENSSKQNLTEAQDATLVTALHYLTEENLVLDETYSAMIDALCENCSKALKEASLEYLFRVRFPALGVKESLDLVLKQEEKYPSFARMVLALLEAGENPLLWESYCAKKLFAGALTPGNILKIMKEYNSFNNPMGPFEQKAKDLWMRLAKTKEEFADEDLEQLKDYSDLFSIRWKPGTEKMNASEELKARLKAELIELFWEKVTFEMIYDNADMIDRDLFSAPEKYSLKMQLVAICLQVRKDAASGCRDFVEDISAAETTPEMREALCECAKKMFYVRMKEKKDLAWDLLLCSVWQVTEKGSGPDLKRFLELCQELDKKLERIKEKCGDPDISFDAEASILLEDEALKKAVCKLDGKSFALDALIDAIKPEKKGLFGKKKTDKKDKRGGRDEESDADILG